MICTVYPQFLVAYDTGGHGGWERIYADLNFYKWLLTQSKNPGHNLYSK